jgi:hypothetical protein
MKAIKIASVVSLFMGATAWGEQSNLTHLIRYFYPDARIEIIAGGYRAYIQRVGMIRIESRADTWRFSFPDGKSWTAHDRSGSGWRVVDHHGRAIFLGIQSDGAVSGLDFDGEYRTTSHGSTSARTYFDHMHRKQAVGKSSEKTNPIRSRVRYE